MGKDTSTNVNELLVIETKCGEMHLECYSLGLPQVQKTVVTRTNWVESRTPNHVFKSNHDGDQCWGFFLAGKIPTISPIEFCTAFTFEPLNTLGLFSRSAQLYHHDP